MVCQSVSAAVQRLHVPASGLGCRVASIWLADQAALHGVSDAVVMRLDLCLNEALANVIAHGGPKALEHPIELTLDFRPDALEPQAVLTITDEGIPFNPLERQTPSPAQSLLDAEPGGLGLHMIQANSDALSYGCAAGRNALTVTVRWPRS